uniref:Uncharacterized protein n=1 Tax=Arundo donax TaxID=35708 RepID=A0A0A9NY30_ARUDO
MLCVTKSGPTPFSVIFLQSSRAFFQLPADPHAFMTLLYVVRLGGIAARCISSIMLMAQRH